MESANAHLLIPSASIRECETQDGIVLLDVQHGMCFPLDPIGTLIWKQIKEGSQAAEIAQKIATTCDIPLEQASVDVQEFVQQLQHRQLVGPAEPASSGGSWFKGILTKLWTRGHNMARSQ
jgi:hypothetical protein